MRVAVYHNNKDVRIEERPVPSIGPGEILLRVRASGICGSDVMEWYRVPRAPLVLGHELSGEIEATNAPHLKAGDRVVLSHHVPCGECAYCRRGHPTVCDTLRSTNLDPGGFGEFVRVPAINVRHGVFHIPDDLSFEEATFTEPLGCVLRGQRFASVSPDDSVLVLGSGLTGLLHIRLARAHGGPLSRASGASRVFATDVNPFRLEAALRCGADGTIPSTDDVPARLRALNEGRLADCVLVCTGAASAISQAFRSVERGGTVLLFAPTNPGREIAMPYNDLWHDEVTITSSYGAGPRDMESSLELLARRLVRVDDLISHRLPLDHAAEGFRLTAEAQHSLKVILNP